MDALDLVTGLVAGLAATAVVMAVQMLAWLRWGRASVFEWQEAEVGAQRLLGRRSMQAGLALHLLLGGVAGIAFVVGAGLLAVAPSIPLGLAFGFAMWVITLFIHKPITGSAARGSGVPVSLLTHLVYGGLLGAWAG